jgi:hypothetical protein
VFIGRRSCALALALSLCSAPLQAQPLALGEVKAAMARVEAILLGMGIDAAGYAAGEAPEAELAPAEHLYLQGNDGGYVDGRVYISERSIEACRDLTLVHELVHDTTVKRRLFASVANEDLRAAIEALADAVTMIAAEDPYRPGCLPNRAFAHASAELVKLANAAP